MTTLVVGASGATGRLLIQQLLARDERVKVIVRSITALNALLPVEVLKDKRLVITQADLLSLTDAELEAQVTGCQAVISCLGHNLNFKGVFGQPRHLVTDATQRLCYAISSTPSQGIPVKFVLLNTTGNRNVLAGEKTSILETIIMSFIRALLPPHADNENAAAYLQQHLYCTDTIEWVVVRPDSLINNGSVTDYEVHPSPIRSAIFNAGKTSRINVAHFMSQLVSNQDMWQKWKSQMPVIYNKTA
ncbi:SDR family oxidoreductase [Motilimonas cestriensis]|uniref:SDR family oxidoreductase n=1 Tax=Motilimonas cestriensis TaxID=2742685 RepID=A0ABS8WA78_9GAMM|nr:NAD(P)-binding oxidoreductase [Motilimonas cestriensis]MCE2594491.1 SDR family oxidoreductase [Motilimonas cestriensis]